MIWLILFLVSLVCLVIWINYPAIRHARRVRSIAAFQYDLDDDDLDFLIENIRAVDAQGRVLFVAEGLYTPWWDVSTRSRLSSDHCLDMRVLFRQARDTDEAPKFPSHLLAERE